MTFEYTAENHDWDLTLRAAWNLLMSGQAAQRMKSLERQEEQVFSFFTGSMMLSFCTIESFTNSIAFSMDGDTKFKSFDYEAYRKMGRFWNKLKGVCDMLDCEIDKSKGIFQSIATMQNWRNSLAHTSAYEIETTVIKDTKKESKKLHKPFESKEYGKFVNVENAKIFYSTAYDYIDLIKKKSGLDSRTKCTYKGLSDEV